MSARAVRESQDRVRAAIRNAGGRFPVGRVKQGIGTVWKTVKVAVAWRPSRGTSVSHWSNAATLVRFSARDTERLVPVANCWLCDGT
jgi:hypothetical protein